MEAKVLIIDDDQSSILLCSKFLRDYETYSEQDSRKAVSLFREIKPELVLLDYAMPYVTGLEIAKEIRLINNDCKIIMMSTSRHEEDEPEKYCDAFFVKPLSKEEISNTVKELLQKN